MEKERKLQIIKAAEKRFVKHGLHKTTLDEIARDLRIGKSTLYHYFKSKEDLYFSTIRWEVNQYLNTVSGIISKDLQVKEKIEEYLTFKETVFENYKLILSLFIQFMNDSFFEEEVEILDDLYSREEILLKESLNKIIYKTDDQSFSFPASLVHYTWGAILNQRVSRSNTSQQKANGILKILLEGK